MNPRLSASRSMFSCGLDDGEKPLDPWASGQRGQACLLETQPEKFKLTLFFPSDVRPLTQNFVKTIPSKITFRNFF